MDASGRSALPWTMLGSKFGAAFLRGKGRIIYGHPTEKIITNTELLHNAMPNADVHGKVRGILLGLLSHPHQLNTV